MGESGTAINGLDQYTLMGALIRGWRLAWGQGEFAFIFIQKPSDGGCRIMNYPNTAMAISSDLGPGIHPINKSGYGTRASQVALGMVYG